MDQQKEKMATLFQSAEATCPEEVVALLRVIAERQTEMIERDNEHERRLNDVLEDAFPNGDYRSHRRAHEAQIAAENEKQKFYAELRNDLVKRGIILIAGLLITMIGGGFVVWMRSLLK